MSDKVLDYSFDSKSYYPIWETWLIGIHPRLWLKNLSKIIESQSELEDKSIQKKVIAYYVVRSEKKFQNSLHQK